MPAIVLTILGSLGGVFYSMLVKLLGYEFITRTLVIGGEAWAKSKKSHNDQLVVESMAKAWGVPVDQFPKLQE